ncbi:MAG TPA: phage tail tape measure protein, partial [Nocardioidaceae bacterium]
MGANDLNVKVDATTTGYEAAIGRAQRATLNYDLALKRLESDMMKLEKELDDQLNAALQRQHDAMAKTGRAAFVFGAAVATGLGLAMNEAVKWESAWTGVTKTVDGTAAEMADLEDGLRSLATRLPATHEEIAAVAEAAGQLGIQRDAILGFTKTMIDLSETTNLTADEAATDMARFANIMQTPQDQIDRLGASLVALGNDGASTESDILSMAMRIAGAGAQLGLTEGEVMGLANALSSVGIEAEAGGSAISMVMKNMQVAVSSGGQSLADFARVAGMSSEEFTSLWNDNAAAGLDAFVTGLGNISAQGGDVISVLNQMGITQIRQSDALLRLAGAGDLLTESLELGNKAWDENSALLVEANKRYETTEAKVEMARNSLRDAAITAGDVLLPALAGVADVTGDLLAAWDQLPGPLRAGVVVLGAIAAAVALVGGASLMAIPKIAAFKTAVAELEAGALKTAGTRIMGLSSALMGPWGLALAAGTLALGLFAAKQGDAARAVDALKATLDEQTGALTENSREWAIKELSDSGALKAAKDLGLNLSLVTDAALGNRDALAAVNGELDTLLANTQQSLGSRGGRNPALEQGRQQALDLQAALNDTNGTLADAREKWQLENAAKGASADGSKKAADAQKG